MIKYFFVTILLGSTSLNAQDSLKIVQKWGENHEHPFMIKEGLYFYQYGEKLYARYEKLNEPSYFYMDVEKNATHSSFFELGDDFKLKVIEDQKLNREVFLNVDWSSKWSPQIYVDAKFNSVQKEKDYWTNNMDVLCNYNGINYVDKISYQSIHDEWNLYRTSLLSDSSEFNSVFIAQSGLNGVFANVYFIHFDQQLKKFNIVERLITYQDLGFDTDKLSHTVNYNDHEFRINGQPGVLFCFNIQNSTKLGLSTIIFDTKKDSIKIHSVAFNNDDLPILQDFNEVEATIDLNDHGTIDYFLNLHRCQITHNGKSNTTLESAAGEEVFYIQFKNGNYSDHRKFELPQKGLQYVTKIEDDFVYVYDSKPNFDKYDRVIKIGNESRFKLWVIHFSTSGNKFYEISLSDKKDINPSILGSDFSFIPINNSSFKIISYLGGSMFTPSIHYRIGELLITK